MPSFPSCPKCSAQLYSQSCLLVGPSRVGAPPAFVNRLPPFPPASFTLGLLTLVLTALLANGPFPPSFYTHLPFCPIFCDQGLLTRVLSALPDGGLRDGSILSVKDELQHFNLQLLISHQV